MRVLSKVTVTVYMRVSTFMNVGMLMRPYAKGSMYSPDEICEPKGNEKPGGNITPK
jgi:hypothetical protein